ncbi:MAG: hypothetical protein ABR529_13990 [Actinomycetota bacterium]
MSGRVRDVADLERTASHEAAHVLVAVKLHWPFESATIDPEEGSNGHVSLRAPENADQARTVLAVFLAGVAFAGRYALPAEPDGPTDAQMATRVWREFGLDVQDWADAYRTAERLLADNRRSHTMLASALVHYREIGERLAEQIVEYASS